MNDNPVLAPPDGGDERTESAVAAQAGPIAGRFVEVDARYAIQLKVGRETVRGRPAQKKMRNRTKGGSASGGRRGVAVVGGIRCGGGGWRGAAAGSG